jgi:hypothetical protein
VTGVNAGGLVLVGVNEFVANRLLESFESRPLVGLFGQTNRAVSASIRRTDPVLSCHSRAGLEGHTREVNVAWRQLPRITEHDLVGILSCPPREIV